MKSTFYKDLYNYIDEFVHRTYEITRKFPREELFGSTSQFRRAALSIMLNYKEGFARKKRLVKINFMRHPTARARNVSTWLISHLKKSGSAKQNLNT